MKKRIPLLVVIIAMSTIIVNAQGIKGLYVNDFVSIVGDAAAEDALLAQAQANGYN